MAFRNLSTILGRGLQPRCFSSSSDGSNFMDTVDFDLTVTKLREFFKSKGCLEVYSQNRLSILAACEDPKTISTFEYEGQTWPLPQTGQMWLECEMLKRPHLPGLFSVGTSYRHEPNPVPGRHQRIFGMFEFELRGGTDELLKMEAELLNYLGFPTGDVKNEFFDFRHSFYPGGSYRKMSQDYQVEELDNDHELRMKNEHGSVFFLKDFPLFTSPFWNMAKYESDLSEYIRKGDSKKVDVIVNGVETIGSAERSCDPEYMREQFYTISDGQYAEILFNKFGRQRVEKELEAFLKFNFFPRSGGGIGMSRLISAMKEYKLL